MHDEKSVKSISLKMTFIQYLELYDRVYISEFLLGTPRSAPRARRWDAYFADLAAAESDGLGGQADWCRSACSAGGAPAPRTSRLGAEPTTYVEVCDGSNSDAASSGAAQPTSGV